MNGIYSMDERMLVRKSHLNQGCRGTLRLLVSRNNGETLEVPARTSCVLLADSSTGQQNV
jgi:hypothetical protein